MRVESMGRRSGPAFFRTVDNYDDSRACSERQLDKMETRYEKLLAVTEDESVEPPYPRRSASPPPDNSRMNTRLGRRKAKFCAECGGPMTKSTRMVLSPLWGIALIVMGTLHMAAYGAATTMVQAPWFLRFALPAIYYIGSILIAVGVCFFFIRERVWRCSTCRETARR